MSSKQFYIAFAISIITMKMQRLPCLVSGELGKDGWLLFLFFTLINIIGIMLVFWIFRKIDLQNVLNYSKNNFFNILRGFLLLATTLYFLVQASLVYEHIQGLFAYTLFDNLSWPFFSLFLLFAVFLLAHRGIENIGLNFEIYFWIIAVSFLLISIFGANQCNFSVVLPFETINFKSIFPAIRTFSCWFGDFFLVLYLGIKAKDIKLSKTLLTYIVSMLFMTFLYIEFVGIYDKYAAIELGLISVLSEQSLLDLSIGRVDWFLILFTEIGAILSCSISLYFANLCLHSALSKARSIFLKIFNALVLYVLDIFILIDINAKIEFFCNIMCDIDFAIQIISLVILFGLMLKKCTQRQPTLNKSEARL